MNLAENRQKLYERMVENMKKDELATIILPLSKFGLMQITRQRVRPAMDVKVEESCPTCGGTGKIKSSLLFTDALEGKIQMLADKLIIKKSDFTCILLLPPTWIKVYYLYVGNGNLGTKLTFRSFLIRSSLIFNTFSMIEMGKRLICERKMKCNNDQWYKR